MEKITVVGTGYVGLVTGASLAEIGHDVTCIDVDVKKINRLENGDCPIYEPGLEELIKHNIHNNRLHFKKYTKGIYQDKEIIIVAVGTPSLPDGTADMRQIYEVIDQVTKEIERDFFLIIKSTVPVGSNKVISERIKKNLNADVEYGVISNPEFLREGSAVKDTFEADRIVVGADSKKAEQKLNKIYQPFNRPIIYCSAEDAEMSKYAANAFLATKISFINEIANICNKVGADINHVSDIMGLDERIGPQFLQAGLGYGGTCFPKDTRALVQIANRLDLEFNLLKAVIEVNNNQPLKLINQVKQRLGSLNGRTISILGLAFKPNTDDVREAPSLVMIKELKQLGAHIRAYDPVATQNVKHIYPELTYSQTIEECIHGSNAAIISTDWDEFKRIPYSMFEDVMENPIIFDGRNIYDPTILQDYNIEYHSVGRPPIYPK